MGVILKKDGFYEEGSRKNVQDEWEEYEEKIDTVNEWHLLQHWKDSVRIYKDVTCNDFFMVLADMDEGMLTVIEMLIDSNIKPFLRKAFDPLPADWQEKDDWAKLTAVEVYTVMELTNRDGRTLGDYALDEHWPSAHGIGAPWKDDHSDPPLSDEEKVKQGMNTYGLEFTPWNELAHLKLTIRPKMWFGRTVWKKGERRKMISNGGDDEWNFTDLDLDKENTKHEEVDYTMRLGEFFDGFANELCFFGSPANAEAERQEMNRRIEDVKDHFDPEDDEDIGE